jgi:hypothetical protein
VVIFEGTPGRVIQLDDAAIQATVRPVVTAEPSISFAEERSVITRVTVSQQTNHQFLHTLGNDIFIYVFGDRMGQLTLSGLSVTEDCSEGRGGEHGLEKMMRWYRDNKLSSRKSPVNILLGRLPLTGFVTGMNNDLVDPKTWLVQFALTVAIVPEKQT